MVAISEISSERTLNEGPVSRAVSSGADEEANALETSLL
ncbi:hypothetical protein CA13_02030 [Planctomycetes bacterium CA13]|uniref:Uncharacterized protein n=1 Tax=Novipirellula herctigrandis TaxID=2527986 RepID=A0A5C5YVL2_9BACT|nr:hypothetical protein CA13_02030 [Planctomycetes bacterium CA13]